MRMERGPVLMRESFALPLVMTAPQSESRQGRYSAFGGGAA